MSDSKLWEEISQGDTKALKLIHDKFYLQMCLYSNKIINDPEKTKELVSDCFIKLWNKREKIVIKDSIKSYLFFMLRNHIIDYTKTKEYINKSHDYKIPEIQQEDYFDEQEYFITLHKAIRKLPLQQQKVLNLAIYKSMTYKQISDVLDIGISTVKTHMGRAYRFLKDELDPKDFYLFFYLRKNN